MNTESPSLTIIVPVYKAEKYIRSCLDSILAQTYKDYEIILVDDGSPDDSGRICDEYALTDSRIKVIHKQNGGPGAARNDALDIAGGRYITFIDSDDEYGTATTLEENISIMETDPSIDYLQYPFVYVGDFGERFSYVPEKRLSSKTEILDYMLDYKIKGYLCTKIVRAGLFEGLRCPTDLLVTEDLCVLINLLEKVNTVYLSECGQYRYYKRENSLVAAKSIEKEMDCACTYRKLLSLSKKYSDVDRNVFAKRFFGTLSHLLGVHVQYGADIGPDLKEIFPYIPSAGLLLGKLRCKYKMKILQIKVFGIKHFVEWNVYFKRRRLNKHN